MRDGRVNAKISRKSTHSIMTNTGFGDLVIKQQGLAITVPQRCIKQNGTPRKSIATLLCGDGICKETAQQLLAKGCRLEVIAQ